MADVALPLAFTVFVWWFGTGAVLWLCGLPARTFPRTMAAVTALLPVAFYALVASRDTDGAGGAYVAFTAAVMVWAWQEVAFLLGYVTGPRRAPCPDGLAGWARAVSAFRTISHHEVALLLLGAGVVAATWGGSNRVGFWTFAILWTMRQSAKLNLFLGVRNRSESFLPAHLAYLASYFLRRPINPLMPVSLAGAGIALALVVDAARRTAPGAEEAVGLALLATLLAAALFEHVFMVLPLPADGLWRWGLASRGASATPGRTKG